MNRPPAPDVWENLSRSRYHTRLLHQWQEVLQSRAPAFQRRFLRPTGIAQSWPCTVAGGCGHPHVVREIGDQMFVAISTLGNDECSEIELGQADLTLYTLKLGVIAESVAGALSLKPPGRRGSADAKSAVRLGEVQVAGSSLPVLLAFATEPKLIEREAARLHGELKSKLVLLLLGRALLSAGAQSSARDLGIIPQFLDDLIEVREDGGFHARCSLDAAVIRDASLVVQRRAWFEPATGVPGEANGAAALPESTHPYRFARMGEAWEVTFEGRTFFLRARERVEYLRMLLERPGVEFSTIDMVARVAQLEATPLPEDMGDVLDAAALVSLKEEIRKVGEKLQEAEEFGFAKDAEDHRTKRTELLAHWSAATGKKGKSRKMGSTSELFRKRVGNAISRAIQDIKGHDPGLAAHLKQAVIRGGFCRYCPDPPIEWKF